MHSPVFPLPILFALGFNNQEKGVLARKSDDLWMSAQYRLHVGSRYRLPISARCVAELHIRHWADIGSRCRDDIESNIGPMSGRYKMFAGFELHTITDTLTLKCILTLDNDHITVVFDMLKSKHFVWLLQIKNTCSKSNVSKFFIFGFLFSFDIRSVT